MEFVFAGSHCYKCGKGFGKKKPKEVTEVEPYFVPPGRLVTHVSPCPFCSENVPVMDPAPEPEPEVEPPAPAVEPEEPEPVVEPPPED